VLDTEVLVRNQFGRERWYPAEDIVAIRAPDPTPTGPSPREKRESADMDALLNLCVEHARGECARVWSGGTVDVDNITFFWSNRYSWAAGYAYKGRAVPNDVDGRYAIGLAPAYYHQHGLAALLSTVRHELIHMWQAMHPDGGRIGHGPKFKQWVDDMNTTRYCHHYSK
jgi:hypothetical protein